MSISAVPRLSLEQTARHEIKAWMARLDLTQEQLAERIGQTQPWVSKRLRGMNRISVEDLGMIADGLGVDPVLLLSSPEKVSRVTGRYRTAAHRGQSGNLVPFQRAISARSA